MPLKFRRPSFVCSLTVFRCRLCAVTIACCAAAVASCAAAVAAWVVAAWAVADAGLDAGSVSKAENVPLQVTSIRLTKDNYLSWSAALEIGITSRGRLSYITGDKPASLKSDPQWATWALEDSQVKVWIISSVSSDIQLLILRKPTSFDMWTVLAMMYGRKKRHLRTYQIKRNHSLHWEKEWMDHTFLFLGGLRDEFEPIRSQILNGDEIPGIEEVYARVESEEQRRQVMHLTTGSVPSAFVSRASGTGQRPARRCTHCNKLGHSADFCWDLHPEKRLVRGRPPSARRSPSLSDSSQGTPSTGVKTKLSPDQLKELQAYIGRLSTTPEESSTVSATVSNEKDSQMEATVRNENEMVSQMEWVTADARDHLFGQVYVRTEKATVEDVDHQTGRLIGESPTFNDSNDMSTTEALWAVQSECKQKDHIINQQVLQAGGRLWQAHNRGKVLAHQEGTTEQLQGLQKRAIGQLPRDYGPKQVQKPLQLGGRKWQPHDRGKAMSRIENQNEERLLGQPMKQIGQLPRDYGLDTVTIAKLRVKRATFKVYTRGPRRCFLHLRNSLKELPRDYGPGRKHKCHLLHGTLFSVVLVAAASSSPLKVFGTPAFRRWPNKRSKADSPLPVGSFLLTPTIPHSDSTLARFGAFVSNTERLRGRPLQKGRLKAKGLLRPQYRRLERAGVDSFSSARRRRLTGASRRLIGASCRHPIVFPLCRLLPPHSPATHPPVASTSARNTSAARATTSARRLPPPVVVVFSCRRTVARLLPSSPADAIVRRCRLPPPVASCCSPGVFSASCRSSDVTLLRRLIVRLVCRRLPSSPAACCPSAAALCRSSMV
ncbi:hypothetical protein EJ110_NYTH58666 [Nymphaea thermarum]|nr:hypothetical protein EJ110_NYTH58666 [Nymphaea thermarum]